MSGKGSNSRRLRHYNERVVLDVIRRMTEASKAEIARAANLTPAAVAGIVDELEERGFVNTVGKRFGQRGSPSTLYRLNANRMFSVGIKIGRRVMEAVLVDFAGTVQMRQEHEYAFPDPDVVRKSGNAALRAFTDRVTSIPEASLIGLGLAAPYFLGGWTEELGFPADLGASWGAVDLKTFFDTGPALPVFQENDASAAALAELILGAGSGYRDFMYVTVDTFVGGGLVQNGKVNIGPHGNSAALGPLPVSPSTLPSMAAKEARSPSLLHRASIYVLVNHLQSHGITLRRVRELEPLSADAQKPVTEWLEDCAGALSEAIAAICSVVDLEAIIIDSILPRPIHRDLFARVEAEFTRSPVVGIVAPKILCGHFGPGASAMGAALLPFSSLLAPDSSTLVLGSGRASVGQVG